METLVTDEVAFLRSLVPLEGATVVELGCGRADFARRLVECAAVAKVEAFEVDRIQHRKNLEGPANSKLSFRLGGAEKIDLGDASVNGVVMMKSLHHVPVPELDRALAEIRRVLEPGGWLYVSEPVYAGEFNAIVKLFHDEGAVRAAAYEALQRAGRAGVLRPELEREFMAPLAFRDFDDFAEKVIRATHSEHVLTAALEKEVRRRFEAHLGPGGAKFTRPMRVNLLRRPPVTA
jgi:ubiquinone/menaquinone biosynthesis C-methylase UbiE